jgi:7,8-dihydropterin-6-yl-methyl-4-(beta-D-ribofuranosyl)aminobenzene 5'-phosphate synthase
MAMTTNSPTLAIGALKRLRILCISETGWFDTATVFDDIRAAGGVQTDQYAIPWPPFGPLHAENAAGFSALLEAEATDGTVRRLLFDTGWNPDWMDRRFAEEGIDRLLQEGQIEALIVSHEHFDHFWGIGSTLKHCPNIPIYVPEGFHPAGLAFILQQGHTGTVISVPTDQPLVLFPGLALVSFPMSTLLQVQGENVLYANLQNKGLAMITGCGHGGVLNLLDYARPPDLYRWRANPRDLWRPAPLAPGRLGHAAGPDRQRAERVWHRQTGVQSLHRAYRSRKDAGERLAGTTGNGAKRITDGFVPGQR